MNTRKFGLLVLILTAIGSTLSYAASPPKNVAKPIKTRRIDPSPCGSVLILQSGKTYRLRYAKKLSKSGWFSQYGTTKKDKNGDLLYTVPVATLNDHLDFVSYNAPGILPRISLSVRVKGSTPLPSNLKEWGRKHSKSEIAKFELEGDNVGAHALKNTKKWQDTGAEIEEGGGKLLIKVGE